MKVWILQCAETNLGFGEDDYQVEGVYSDESWAEMTAKEYKANHKHGACFITDHVLQKPTIIHCATCAKKYPSTELINHECQACRER